MPRQKRNPFGLGVPAGAQPQGRAAAQVASADRRSAPPPPLSFGGFGTALQGTLERGGFDPARLQSILERRIPSPKVSSLFAGKAQDGALEFGLPQLQTLAKSGLVKTPAGSSFIQDILDFRNITPFSLGSVSPELLSASGRAGVGNFEDILKGIVGGRRHFGGITAFREREGIDPGPDPSIFGVSPAFLDFALGREGFITDPNRRAELQRVMDAYRAGVPPTGGPDVETEPPDPDVDFDFTKTVPTQPKYPGVTPVGWPEGLTRDPSLNPEDFDPTLGAPTPTGIDFGTSPFSQLIESGLGGLISAGGGPTTQFGADVRNALAANLGQLARQKAQADQLGQPMDPLAGGPAPQVNPFVTEGPVAQQLQQGRFGFRPGDTGLSGLGSEMAQAVSGLVSQGVQPSQDVIGRSTESVREALDRQRRAQVTGTEAALARRGLIGSGPQRTSLEGLERDIASQFASAMRDIGTGELTRARGTFEKALGLGTDIDQFGRSLAEQSRQFDVGTRSGLFQFQEGQRLADLARRDAQAAQQADFFRTLGSRDVTELRSLGQAESEFARGQQQREREFARGFGQQERFGAQADINQLLGISQGAAALDQQSMLSALGQATQRQEFLTNAAMQLIQNDRAFSQFLAQFGLQRAQVMEQISQGRMANLLPFIEEFFKGAGLAQRGAV